MAKAQTKLTERDEALARNVSLRAKLSSLFNNTDSYMSVTDVKTQLKADLEKLGVTDKILAAQLKGMATNKLITSYREGVRNMFGGSHLTAVDNLKPKKTKVDIKIKPLKSGKVSDYKIDVVKGQQRVRITIDNVMFDIGVVNN